MKGLVAAFIVLWTAACERGSVQSGAQAASPSDALIPVQITWENPLEPCIRLEALGAQILVDRWGARHFVVGVAVDQAQPLPTCCGPTEAVDYEARATVSFEGGSYVYASARGAAHWSPDRRSLSLGVPLPISGDGQQTSYDVAMTCGPHD